MEFYLKLCWSLLLILLLPRPNVSLKFTIVHNNDMHARYDPVKGSSEKCDKDDDAIGLCFGGFARIATFLQKVRSEGPTLYLNAGDTFQGTLWYSVYKGKLAAELLNILKPDAVSLGNHEFDDNIEGLLPFINTARFPIVNCNMNLNDVPEMEKVLVPSTIITKFERKIGIIGYLSPDINELNAVHNIEFKSEILSINNEAKNLLDQGVNIIIALGHSGYKMDQEIAESCPDVDVVIGGHSHTFLYTGYPPEIEKPEGNYPTVVFKENGRKVPVLQAYAFTKYMGKISLEFDDAGILIDFKGTPILLDSSVSLDSRIKSILDSKRSKIGELEEEVVGTSRVILNGDKLLCRTTECNLGNFIGDAFVYGRVVENYGSLYWTDAAIAVVNSGAIRASVDPGEDGSITGSDIVTILPFGNTISVTRILGINLARALEHSVNLRGTFADGGFLQVSGIRFVVNYNRPRGMRVTSVSVLCADCRIPQYQPLNMEKYYNVLVPSFITDGGDGHRYFKEARSPDDPVLQTNDWQTFSKYLQEHKVVYPTLDRRITILEKKPRSSAFLQLQVSPAYIFFVIVIVTYMSVYY